MKILNWIIAGAKGWIIPNILQSNADNSKLVSVKHLNDILMSDHDCKDMHKLTKTRRRRYNTVGIYDECCRTKGCTVKELQSYCL
ncbi:hypothetical protein FF38_05940 [Lucilia cuprina]|uniref:Insulin-like domain-containing protein n=1 Tax=Lucilia cuprina TaxID=7375 RepID=A0A0L0CPH9_LUCCU|nr:hypothetical protein FF38_05940 [Lucilia cuprina]